MPRLANRGTTNRAPDSAASFPAFPNMDSQLSEVDGGRTNAAIQRWNSQMRSRLEGNAQQDNGRFRDIQTTITRQDGYLESVWTMQAIAGPVVTGMTLFSSTGPDASQTVSRVVFQADVFQIQTATGNRKVVFSTSADEIKLGDVLTVDLVNAKVYIGTGTYGNANTAFYVDDDGYFSLKSKLLFDPTGAGTLVVTGTIVAGAGSIGGWDITATTIAKNDATLDSAGQLILGTSNDIIYISATDATYRIWAGNVTAATASFSVSKAGALFSNSGMIGGFSIGSNSLSVGSGSSRIELSNLAGGFLRFGDTGSPLTDFAIEGMTVMNSGGNFAIIVRSDTGSGNYGIISIYDGAGNITIGCDGSTGAVTATSFAGSGASLTSLNASNLSSGTVGTARLGSGSASSSTFLRGDQTWAGITSGNVSGLAASATTDTTNASNISSGTLNNARLSFSATGTGDVPVNGFVNVGGVKFATVA